MTIPRLPITLFALVAAAACNAPRSSSLPAPTASGVARDASVEAPPVTLVSGEDASAPAPIDIVGFTDLSPTPKEAIAENDAAFALHKKGDYKSSAEGFARALTIAPGFVLARYNLACAKSRLSDFAGARLALEEVYRRDAAGFAVLARKDEDLAAFWKSDEAPKTLASLEYTSALFNKAIERGVRALYWLPGARTGDGRQGITEVERPKTLRAGVYDDATHAFLATTAREPATIVAFVDREYPLAVVISGSIPDMLGGDLAPLSTMSRVTQYGYSTTGTPAMAWTPNAYNSASLSILGTDEASASIELFNGEPYGKQGGKDLLWQVTTLSTANGPKTSRYTDKIPVKSRAGAFVASMGIPAGWGFSVSATSAGMDFNGRAVTFPDGTRVDVPKDLALGKEFASVVASPDKSVAIVVLAAHACGNSCEGGFVPGRHRILRVDKVKREVTKLAEGTGVGAARFDDAGNLFIQRDRIVERWTQSGSHALPAGVLLVTPLIPDNEIACCGFSP